MLFFGVLDIRTGDFTYVNCGHNPPLLRQGTDGAFTYLRPAKKNLMMGVEEDLRFTQERLQMSPGSLLFCYTDGVTEAMNEAGEVYSEGQLQADLTGIPSGNASPLMQGEPNSLTISPCWPSVTPDKNHKTKPLD